MEPTVEIYFERIIRETELAWLLETADGEVWLPKSPCLMDEDEKFVVVPERLAIDKGLV